MDQSTTLKPKNYDFKHINTKAVYKAFAFVKKNYI